MSAAESIEVEHKGQGSVLAELVEASPEFAKVFHSPFDKLRANGLQTPSEQCNSKPVVAAFDFDGTLTRRDTLLPFLRYLLGDVRVARDAFMLSSTLARYALGAIDNGIAKERVFFRCLGGMPADELQRGADGFALYVLPGLLRHEAMQRFDWHKQQGHRCVVISASLEAYVRPWAERASFDDVIATQLEMREDGCITGKLPGINCFGSEKTRRLGALLGARDGYTLYAYGDSRGDRELLSSADYAYYRQIPESGNE